MTRTRRSSRQPIPDELNAIGTAVVESAIAAHRRFGPGLLERVYQLALMDELDQRGICCELEVPVPLAIGRHRAEPGYRMDALVEDQVVVEVKAVDALVDAHIAQLLTYMRLANKRLGYLLNFNGERLVHGLRRLVL